jgi:hypothetical protein
MTPTTHTQGDWYAEDGFVFADNGLRIADCHCDDQPRAHDEIDANARLIATSPQRDAFIHLIAGMTKDGEDDFILGNDDAVDALHALIDKARTLASATGRKNCP